LEVVLEVPEGFAIQADGKILVADFQNLVKG
jgi:hypothetical protein